MCTLSRGNRSIRDSYKYKVHSWDFTLGSKVPKIHIQTLKFFIPAFMTPPATKARLGEGGRLFNLAVRDEFLICHLC